MLNESLKVLRAYLGMTQAELATKLGLSQSYLSELERGDKEVSIDVLRKYSKELDIPMSSLLFFAESLEGEVPISRKRIFIAGKVLKILKQIAPAHVDAKKD